MTDPIEEKINKLQRTLSDEDIGRCNYYVDVMIFGASHLATESYCCISKKKLSELNQEDQGQIKLFRKNVMLTSKLIFKFADKVERDYIAKKLNDIVKRKSQLIN